MENLTFGHHDFLEIGWILFYFFSWCRDYLEKKRRGIMTRETRKSEKKLVLGVLEVNLSVPVKVTEDVELTVRLEKQRHQISPHRMW